MHLLLTGQSIDFSRAPSPKVDTQEDSRNQHLSSVSQYTRRALDSPVIAVDEAIPQYLKSLPKSDVLTFSPGNNCRKLIYDDSDHNSRVEVDSAQPAPFRESSTLGERTRIAKEM